MAVVIDGRSLKIKDVVKVAKGKEKVELSEEAKQRVEKCWKTVKQLVAKGEAIYGVTTGIGELASVRISPDKSKELQKRIIFSHSAGTGRILPQEDVRAAMVVRANTMAKGHTGVRLSTLELWMEMINREVVPMVYEKGSVGVSGDLSPMSQIAEVAVGTGKAFYKGELINGVEAMAKAGLKPIEPIYKEGLGLINGPQMMSGQACLLMDEAVKVVKNGLIASAMSADALRAVPGAFDPQVHALRPFNGQNATAAAIRLLTEDSEIIADKSGKVQDGYSIRCIPQVFGPTIDIVLWSIDQLEIEINAGSDNPLFFPDNTIHRAAGNFHGQHIGLCMDYCAIAMSEIANLSERHINRMLNPVLSNGLPAFLVEGRGINSGMMVAQYTAASLVSENKILSHPASVDSISVSADQEDHVSMGPNAVKKFREILENIKTVLAIEMMCAAQAIDFRKPKKPGKGTKPAWEKIRERVSHLHEDRPLHPDIKAIKELIDSSEIISVTEKAVGKISLKWEK